MPSLDQERARAKDRELAQARTLRQAYNDLDRAHASLSEEKKKTEEQAQLLLELDDAKSRFFNNISHEFRTPLSLIIGPLEDLQHEKKSLSIDEFRPNVDLAVRNAHRVLDLINQILDVAKLEAGQFELNIQRILLIDYLQGIGTSFRPLAERKAIDYVLSFPEEQLEYYFDPDQMEKVFSNLLSNAFKFTPERGRIEIKLDMQDPKSVRISIIDTGPGIDAKEIEHVFDRFYQAGESSLSQQAGTGIGLSLAKEIVERHAGSIEVTSKKGKGSTFTVTLLEGKNHFDQDDYQVGHQRDLETDLEKNPSGESSLSNDDPSTSPQLESSYSLNDTVEDSVLTANAEEESEEERAIVMVVEDNDEVRKYISTHVSKEFRVLEARNGQVALDLIKDTLPDLVISDVMMDEVDGFELCKQIKSDPETDFVPVILLTARARAEDRLEGLDLQADDYLTKPFDSRELLARTANLIKTRKRLLAKFEKSDFVLHAQEKNYPSQDQGFVDEIKEVLEEHLENENFGVRELAEKMALDRTLLYRKTKKLLSESPAELLWRLRLERAASMLKADAGNISEIAYSVGFKSVAHFTRKFKEQFGKPPRSYVLDNKQD